ncbi:type IV toxin-antitoxin system AbiEi family antitoxin domain-containing protein [Nocardioides sp.]|uniref:type IV toxin-antitoxin system AbiEi family antitoxin domain-containing protein n=1 Tax=Nocardioides sp. TaxID=35761 RepID=UPI002D7F2E59|nr:type IV toxin-antitoxin system AbiEi family antitoxin domain-containing protein [Nocardioides sp.]HET8959060.1 type IV toxin-antitoxin system AbiEi family antitoxin domain-containing protein [Nocardioides sp.]
MDPLRIMAEVRGFFTRAEARGLGYDDRAVTRAVRAQLWLRIRRGYYTFVDLWAGMDDRDRHLARAHAVQHSLGPSVALSDVSGCLEHGIATWDIDLSRVHVTRLDGGAGRIEGDVVHHEGFCLKDDLSETPFGLVLSPARCALEAGARVGGGERGLVVLDSLLNLGLSDLAGLEEQFKLMERWPRMRGMHIPVRMADGDSASVGETRGRWLFWVHHIPAPLLQYQVHDANGALVGTCDWAWPDRNQLGEFDGRVKYGRVLKPGQDVGEVVFAEKQREDLLREITSFGMIRYVWSDYDRPRLAAARLGRQLRRSS